MREGLVLEGSSVCNDDLLFGGLSFIWRMRWIDAPDRTSSDIISRSWSKKTNVFLVLLSLTDERPFGTILRGGGGLPPTRACATKNEKRGIQS